MSKDNARTTGSPIYYLKTRSYAGNTQLLFFPRKSICNAWVCFLTCINNPISRRQRIRSELVSLPCKGNTQMPSVFRRECDCYSTFQSCRKMLKLTRRVFAKSFDLCCLSRRIDNGTLLTRAGFIIFLLLTEFWFNKLLHIQVGNFCWDNFFLFCPRQCLEWKKVGID